MAQRFGLGLSAAAAAALPMLVYFLFLAFQWVLGDLGSETQGWLIVTLPLALGAVALPWIVFVLVVALCLSFPSRIASILGIIAIVVMLWLVLPTANETRCLNPGQQSQNDCFSKDMVTSLLVSCALSGAASLFVLQILTRKRARNV